MRHRESAGEKRISGRVQSAKWRESTRAGEGIQGERLWQPGQRDEWQETWWRMPAGVFNGTCQRGREKYIEISWAKQRGERAGDILLMILWGSSQTDTNQQKQKIQLHHLFRPKMHFFLLLSTSSLLSYLALFLSFLNTLTMPATVLCLRHTESQTVNRRTRPGSRRGSGGSTLAKYYSSYQKSCWISSIMFILWMEGAELFILVLIA